MDRLVHILTRKGIKKAEDSINCKKNILPFDYQTNSIKIINIVCDYYKVDVDTIRYKSNRLDHNILAKQMAIYIIKEDFPRHCNNILDGDIGKLFNIHRTSVIHSYKKIAGLVEVDKIIQREYNDLRERVNLIYGR